jgi:ribosomal protein S27AE
MDSNIIIEKIMTKTTSCPQCGSKKMKMHNPQTSIWKCGKCGYQGSVTIEDGNLEKNIKDARKMDKLSRKLSWRR